MTPRQREIAVTLRGMLHVAWVIGVAAVLSWLSPRADDFLVVLVCVLVAHSAWRAAELEVERNDALRAAQEGEC